MTHLKEKMIYKTVKEKDELQKNAVCEHVICTVWVACPDALVTGVFLQSSQGLGGFRCGSSGDGKATLNASAKCV